MNYNVFGDWIERIWRELAQRPVYVQLVSATTAGQETFQVSGTLTNPQPGMIMSIDLEEFLVLSCDQNTGMAEVVPGYNGSTAAPHDASAICYINPRFSRWAISVALNDDLSDLSSPTNGLFQAGQVDIPFIPAYSAYDLAGVPTNFMRLLEVRFTLPPPQYEMPLIKVWEVLRNQTNARFPSGNGLVIRQPGYSGLPLHVLYAAPFTQLVNVTDPISLTGLPETAYDLPVLGAQMMLVGPQEINRNQISSQPDARKAPEVPPGAIGASANAVALTRQRRINAEYERLAQQYPERKQYLR